MGKEQIYKKAVALSLATAMVAGSATTALAGQWKQDANGYWWDENGSYPKNEWKWLDGNGDGISESYYFGADGYLLTNTTTPDGYTVNADGQWVENGVVKTQGTVKSTGSTGKTQSSAKSNVKQSSLVSYMRDVDKPENTTRVNPVGTGVAFPTTDLKVGDNMYWRNWNGGNEYILYYHGKTDTKAAGDIGDPTSAGYQMKLYPNAQSYWTFDKWTTPDGVTIDYLYRVLDENGKIKTATAEELGLTYEGGKVRDVAYDSNYPLKRVVDLYALNIEATKDWLEKYSEINHHGLAGHNQFITNYGYYIAQLTGQTDPFNRVNSMTDEEKKQADEVIAVLRNWLNSFDFEHATEPERLAKISELLIGSKYDDEVKNNPSLHTYDKFYQVLINKKGVCIDFADTGHLLATLLGLKCAVVGDTVHACWIVQADGVPHMAENGAIDLVNDWRETSKLGTRQSYNFNFGEYIKYE